MGYNYFSCYDSFIPYLGMKKINLAITGCMGRMGQQIIKSARSDKNFKIVTLTENRIINKKVSGIKPSLNTAEAFKKFIYLGYNCFSCYDSFISYL